MIVAGARQPILIATKPVDFRCGHQALALMVQTELKLDPHSGVTVIFRSKRGDRLKILVWDGTGMVLTYTKPEWAAQFRAERDEARERQRMERGLVGRVSLSIAAAREQHREQGGSFTRLVAVNFLSKERRESAFAAASQRDRAALSERLNRELGGKLEPLKAGRAWEMGQALERLKEDRGALVERQAREWGRIREAWRQVGREKVPERGREAEAPKGSRFAWLDRQKIERGASARGAAEPRQQAEQVQDNKVPSRFDWLNRQNDHPTKVRERDDPVGRRKDRDSDRDR